MANTYVDRDEASKILKVSTRTVDRYVRKFRFKTRKNGRRVLIRRIDVDKIIEDHIGHFVDIQNADTNIKPDSNAEKKSSAIQVKDVKIESVRKGDIKDKEDEKVYKNLYIDTKNELKEKQERLEAATYRVGQLESQVKTMVPLLEYNQKEKQLKEAYSTIEQKELEKVREIAIMEQKLKAERIAKWIYVSIVGVLLVAEPIVILLWMFS